MKQIKLAKSNDRISGWYADPAIISEVKRRVELYDDFSVGDEEIDNIIFALHDLGYLEVDND